MKHERKSERLAQKARTRDAILRAAREILADGETLTVTNAANRAGISKATAYRYFSDPALLAAEAGMAIELKSYDDVVAGCRTPREKIRAISLYIFDVTLENEATFRQFLARNLDAWLADPRPMTRRGARRIAMFEAALEDMRADLAPETSDKLVRALATCTGTEAMIGLLDIAESSREAARDSVLDIAEALMDRHLGPETG